jgi:hypothetical protein
MPKSLHHLAKFATFGGEIGFNTLLFSSFNQVFDKVSIMCNNPAFNAANVNSANNHENLFPN